MHIPALLKIGFVFAAALLAIRKDIALGHIFMGSSVLLGFIFGMTPLQLLNGIYHALTHPKTLALACVVSMILVLSHSMEKAREMERLLDSFQGLVRNPRLNLVIFPALIGLLPMPGGAIFSAPMVKNIGSRLGLTGAQLSYINYWFRHIWEYWWPLYPGILLTTTLSGIDLWKFIFCTFPLTVVAILSGYLPLGKVIVSGRSENHPSHPPIKPFLKGLIPIAIVIIGGLGLGSVLSIFWPSTWAPVSKELGLISALTVSVVYVWVKNGFTLRECLSVIVQKQLVKMFYMVCSILIFKTILEESHAAGQITDELLSLGIPLMPVCIILPFLMGLITGITIAFVGTSFPILIVLIKSANQANFMLPYLMLALASGFIGVLVSPVHLCLLLSNEYFHTALQPVYRYVAVPCTILFASMVAYFGLLRYFLPPS
ncbi:DUF401 family protein [Thermodesulforhabdus norvegica]|uniref:DUF401 family protein n=1 Tax=Thermodesulforhabdus norvegica TaxID=39841 RepID=A0A1I4STH9_9BACT|nr:DUF401 family protein [Thermodesulforhabdus norvegica]SFM67650.1 hypothetical protein SAMN05660836_01151 [Thermodesulforhabdus norvegica]